MKKDKSWIVNRANLATLNLTGMKAAVIGGTGGIGREISLRLASLGAHVYVIGQTFRDAGVSGLEFIKADLSLLNEARKAAKAVPAEVLDMLIFTAGIMPATNRETTAEGIERDTATSYLNRLVMLEEISPRLGKARDAGAGKPRVFVMGFPGSNQGGDFSDINAEREYKRWAVHSNTVAGNEILVLDYASRDPSAVYFGLNPGFVKTNIRANLWGKDSLFLRITEGLTSFMTATVQQYVDRVLPVILADGIEAQDGAMFDNKGHPVLPSSKLDNPATIKGFLDASWALIRSREGKAS